MKSPNTGKKMMRMKEASPIKFRKEKFVIGFHLYRCVDSGEQFTTTALDEINLDQVCNQYNNRHNIK